MQSAHAAIAAGMAGLIKDIRHPVLVIATVADEAELIRKSVSLTNASVDHRVFFEDDIDSYTAICSAPIPKDSKLRREFRKYKLLK